MGMGIEGPQRVIGEGSEGKGRGGGKKLSEGMDDWIIECMERCMNR